MPTATLSFLTNDQIDDLLYLARLGETTELKAAVDLFTRTFSTTSAIILTAAVDNDSGNGLLHMAAANGHTETLKELLALSSSNHALSLNLQNASGNTPLHWAALNGHLSAIRLLVEAGADPTVVNRAGKNAVYEAEANEKSEVAAWLLTEAKGVESADGVGLDQAVSGAGQAADEGRQLEEVMEEGVAEERP